MVPLTSLYVSQNTIFYIDAYFGQKIFNQFLYFVSDHNFKDFRVNAGCCYQPYDGAPGGNYPLVTSLLGELKNNIGLNYSYAGSECFVPSTSALSLNCGLYDSIHTTFGFNENSLEVENYLPNSNGRIVFDAMYIGTNNLPHLTEDDSFNSEMKSWLVSQITKEDEFLQNKTISGATKRYE